MNNKTLLNILASIMIACNINVLAGAKKAKPIKHHIEVDVNGLFNFVNMKPKYTGVALEDKTEKKVGKAFHVPVGINYAYNIYDDLLVKIGLQYILGNGKKQFEDEKQIYTNKHEFTYAYKHDVALKIGIFLEEANYSIGIITLLGTQTNGEKTVKVTRGTTSLDTYKGEPSNEYYIGLGGVLGCNITKSFNVNGSIMGIGGYPKETKIKAGTKDREWSHVSEGFKVGIGFTYRMGIA